MTLRLKHLTTSVRFKKKKKTNLMINIYKKMSVKKWI